MNPMCSQWSHTTGVSGCQAIGKIGVTGGGNGLHFHIHPFASRRPPSF